MPSSMSPSAWGTNGGIKVDAALRALDSDNEPIEGLYVPGVNVASMRTMPYYDNPGSSVGLLSAPVSLSRRRFEAFFICNPRAAGKTCGSVLSI